MQFRRQWAPSHPRRRLLRRCAPRNDSLPRIICRALHRDRIQFLAFAQRREQPDASVAVRKGYENRE